MIDIHAHLCFPQFEKDVEKVIQKCREEISGVVVSSARYLEGLKVIELIKKHEDFLFPTLGYHPTEGTELEKTIESIKMNTHELVGIGEVGLDYHWEKNPEKREKQKQIFQRFIELASELDKPLVIHSWDAERECFEMVKDSGLICIFHCFSGSVELAEEIISEKDFYISMSTQVCFSKKHKKLAKFVPLNRLLLETDSPFLSPFKHNPHLKNTSGFPPERNYPWNIKLSAEKIAEIKKISAEEVLSNAEKNARKIFDI